MHRIKQCLTRRGARLLQHGTVLSEVLHCPGPTHSVVDVIAAAALALCPKPQPHIALIGFAAGGILAPLRALHCTGPVNAVDIDLQGVAVFRRLCQAWCGQVRCTQAEAVSWLRARRDTYDIIIEDLSISQGHEVIKPSCVWTCLPALIRQRLRPGGVAVFNLLPPEEGPWSRLIETVSQPFTHARRIDFDAFENRLLVAGNVGIDARRYARRTQSLLRSMGSKQAQKISVRSVPRAQA